VGVQTAELARRLGLFIQEQDRGERLQIICSHRGLYKGEEEAKLTEAGVVLRHIAFFIGEDHNKDTKAGISDIALVTSDDPLRAILLIEIEESCSGTAPKAIIGDGLLPALADRVDLLQADEKPLPLSLSGTEIWVAYHPRKGYDVSRTDRLETKINNLLQKVNAAEMTGPIKVRLVNQPPERLYETLLADAKGLLEKHNPKV
jgi:hypothetical protein